jgi:UDP-N-acetylmuramate dehydrogenase
LVHESHEKSCRPSLTGLEFLEGVPGGIGGIVRMNGGAYDHTICERLSWIRGLKYDGSECTVPASALEWGYRGCKSLKFTVVVEIGLHLNAGNRAEIEAEREQISERRRWMRGLRCSGSVFRNPEGQSAGRLVESLGLKGRRIGGAQVLPRHGNFIVAERDAMASDVLALIQQVQAAVETETGVALNREVVFLG